MTHSSPIQLIAQCYNLVNVVTIAPAVSDHIKRLLLFFCIKSKTKNTSKHELKFVLFVCTPCVLVPEQISNISFHLILVILTNFLKEIWPFLIFQDLAFFELLIAKFGLF